MTWDQELVGMQHQATGGLLSGPVPLVLKAFTPLRVLTQDRSCVLRCGIRMGAPGSADFQRHLEISSLSETSAAIGKPRKFYVTVKNNGPTDVALERLSLIVKPNGYLQRAAVKVSTFVSPALDLAAAG